MSIKHIWLIVLSFGLANCGKKNNPPAPPPPPPVAKVLIGFNQNWSFFPAFNTTMLSKINQLKPQMIRYPGGTVTHEWDWVTGKRASAPNAAPHLVGDVKAIVDATGCKMIFVLDIVNRTITDQVNMLNAIKNLGVPIEYIELGNELYASDAAYVTAFPNGSDYAVKVNQWIPQLRSAFPGVKISALLQCRNADASNQRFANWNSQVVAGTLATVDAYTYHIYISTGSNFTARIAEFDAVNAAVSTGTKEWWVTEYGNQNDLTDPTYYTELEKLANYVEKHSRITIALNHLIVGNNKNKITSDGLTFTPEGQIFLTRASNR